MAGYIGTKAVNLSTTGADIAGDADVSGDLTVDTSTLHVDSTNNRVGIGTISPAHELHIETATPEFNIKSTSGFSSIIIDAASGSDGNLLFRSGGTNTARLVADGSDNMIFKNGSGSTERMRIDSSGNLLVGKTSASTSTVGVEALSNGEMNATVNGGRVISLDRLGSDGDIIRLRKSSTTVGMIGSIGGVLSYIVLDPRTNGIGIRGTNSKAILATGNTGSAVDNYADLGAPAFRFDDIYATNGTIQTSDRNEKQDIAELSDAEQRVAVAAKGLMRKFRWRDAVEAKGDDARTHFGVIAQDLQAAFAAEGLDAGDYAMFISSTWWETQTEVPAVEAVAEVLDEEGNVVTEAVEAKDAYTRTDTYETQEEAPEGATERTRLGVRYSELLAFIIGAL